MKLSFGTNIRVTISDEGLQSGISLTFAGLPAGVDLEKEDFMRSPDSEEPQFGEGRLLCKDGSFVTDGRPFDVVFKSGRLENAIIAAGVLAKHIIAPVRIRSISDTAGECLCCCMPAGLQIVRAAINVPELCQSEIESSGLEEGLSNGGDFKWKVTLTKNSSYNGDLSLLSETIAALSIADSLFF